MSANFVAREIGYKMDSGWMQGDDATNAWFSPLATYEERFAAMLDEVCELGFKAIDLWAAHLNYAWATPAHIAIAKRLLEERELRVASYAGWFGPGAAEFEAACLLARALDIPVLGGLSPLLETDRPALVSILRKYGLVLGYENHPETSIEQIQKMIGEGDEDVVGVALDTGWLATRGIDVMEGVKAFLPRLKHVHLKDVEAKPEEPTGFEFKDMGHGTCAHGEGIVPIQECVNYLITNGYRGELSIEHEPEDFDPRPDTKKSLELVQKWIAEAVQDTAPEDPAGVVIVGCGNIADRYADQINSYPHVNLLGAQDIDTERAEKLTAEFGGKVYKSLDEVLADSEVDIIVNLTIHFVHAEIIRKCLEAGKHVHTEKPLATTSKEAWELVELAEQKGLRLSSAPTTWLGEAQQTALRMIRSGEIGTPRVAYAEVNWGRIESWHPNPGPFYDVGILYDVAVYPITLLTAWFGPVKKVTGAGKVVYPNRKTKEDVPFEVTVEDWASAVIEFECGLMARVTGSFYVDWSTRQQGLEIHGDDGCVVLDRWDVFETGLYKSEGRDLIPQVLDEFPAPGIEFARGLSDLAYALREDRPHKTSGAHAAYVVEIIEAIITSMREGRPVELPTRENLDLPAKL